LPSIRNAGTDRARLLGAAEDPSVYHIAHDDFGRRTRLATSLHSAHPALNSSIFRLVAIGLCSPHSTMPSSLHFGMSSRPSTAIHATSPAQGPLFFFSGIATQQSRRLTNQDRRLCLVAPHDAVPAVVGAVGTGVGPGPAQTRYARPRRLSSR
jgi:hypothetical protein